MLHKYGVERKTSDSFSAWLFILATLFEETIPVPSRSEGKPLYRITISAWTLMSVILVNCYIGLMTTELNPPLEGTRPNTFKALVHLKDLDFTEKNNFWDIAMDNHVFWGNKSLTNWETFSECFQLLSTPFKVQNPRSDRVQYRFFHFLISEYSK